MYLPSGDGEERECIPAEPTFVTVPLSEMIASCDAK
jgi:hypothetical protein